MAAFDKLMSRFGYVRLAPFGLELDLNHRVISLRNAVLDDGIGRPVVGWLDTDPATRVLSTWGRAPAIAAAPPAAVSAQVATAVATVNADDGGADAADDDEWEWTIALARARADAAEDEARVSAPIAIVTEGTARIVRIPPRRRGDTVPPPEEQTPRRPPTQRFVARAGTAPVAAPVTAIDALPTPIPPGAPRRFAKGTATHEPGVIHPVAVYIPPAPPKVVPSPVVARQVNAPVLAVPPLGAPADAQGVTWCEPTTELELESIVIVSRPPTNDPAPVAANRTRATPPPLPSILARGGARR